MLRKVLASLPSLEAIMACQNLHRITGDDHYDLMQSLMVTGKAGDFKEALAWCNLVTMPEDFAPSPRYLLGIGVN
jgi:hypothetical protein